MKMFSILLLSLISLGASGQNPSERSKRETYLPSTLVDGRFYLKIPALNGDTILGFCDTGGGYTAIYPATITRLKLGTKGTFDYAVGKVFINTPLVMNSKDENTQVLGFKKDRSGNKRFGHPRMKIAVDGQSINVLFDTGASFILGENGKTEFGANKTSVGGSFIAKSIFDKWASTTSRLAGH